MPTQRTIEISDPVFESDHLRFITVKSIHLRGRGDICVFVPPNITSSQTLPVAILLHGVYGSAWAWALSGGVHRHALQMIRDRVLPPMIIAMPSDGLWGDGSAYLPHNGYDFEKWITEDVVSVLMGKIPGVKKESAWFIGGLSMGGFGALRIGVKHGQLFRAVSAHSSITSLQQMALFVEENMSYYTQADKKNEDVFETIRQCRHVLPAIRFDCGVDDPLIEYNRLLHRQLQETGVDHIYHEYPGAHEWSYWQQYVRESLLFFAEKI